MPESISRRRFLSGAAAVAAGVALSGPLPAASAARRRSRVVVLGAGLAGLAAAYEIKKADRSVDVVVLEGQNRVGGRVLTARTDSDGVPFADGLHVELGAHRIPSNHDRTLGYIRELGLDSQVVPFQDVLPDGSPSRRKFVLRDTAFYSDEPFPDVLELTPDERADVYAGYWYYETRFVSGQRPPSGSNMLGRIVVPRFAATDWPYGRSDRASVDAWNSITLEQFLAGNGASADWIRFYKAENGSEPSEIAALPWLAQDVLHAKWFDTLYLQGGLDQIADGLAARLTAAGVPIRLEHEILSVTAGPSSTSVLYREPSGALRSIEAARVVCALPFSALRYRGVDLSGAGLTAQKRYWIDNLPMVASARVALQSSTRFWNSEGLEGLHLVGTDTALERIWHSTSTQPAGSGILQAYLQSESARNAPATGTIDWFAQQLAGVLPQVAGGGGWNGQGAAKLWHLDPWVRGAWASPGPGDLVEGFHVWGRPEGRIHFAGEHTSLFMGWMQGALESGQRASAEVLAAL
ncbi:flavin monoamine oxidase family protein [Longivirga aurantiaca]|uniref:Flavin monoamine oxidase family protein n=1 Tax=Longivirga aurantiaca TaxID=1837743 RepID=A0ABW1T1J7_9ACTN